MYDYDRTARANPGELRDLARKMQAILQQSEYHDATVKLSDNTITIKLYGRGRPDWVVMERDAIGPGYNDKGLPAYIYFGPIPVQEPKAFVYVQGDEVDSVRAHTHQQILKALKQKVVRGPFRGA